MKRNEIAGLMRLFRQTRLADLANHMKDKFVRFLDPRGRITLHDKIDIGQPGCRPAIAPKYRDCFQFSSASFFNCAPDIFRFTAGADRYQQVAGIAKRPDLAGKNFIETVIVSGCSN